jgi:asparagine synthase (glutamine-hydrolysing)
MSGICAVWRKADPARTGRSLAAVAGGLAPFGEETVQTMLDGEAGLGVSQRFSTQQIYRNEGIIVACDADLRGEEGLRAAAGVGPREVPAGAGTAALLAALYRRFGDGFVEKLRGGFSVLLWDRKRRALLAAIDGFAINRLVYYEDASVLLVATRINALMRSGDAAATLNPRAIANVLNFTSSLAPETAFANVSRLIPGGLLLARNGRTEVRRYWDMSYGTGASMPEEALARELERVVEMSVSDCARSDGPSPPGAFLSGGTDSSTVVGMMGCSGTQPVKAFSIGFREQAFDEMGYAVIAAKRFKAQHYTYIVDPADCLKALPQMVRAFDEPFANASAIPTYFCARLAAETGTEVLLAGDGGDELFGGNERYRTDKVFGLYQRVPWFVRKGLVEPALAVLPGRWDVIRRGRNYVRRSTIPPLDRFFSFHFLRAHDPGGVFEPDFLDSLRDYDVLEVPRRYYQEAPAADHLDRLLYVDLKITLGDSDLPKVTCMAEMAGVKVRFPFLGSAVAEFSGRVPARLKVKGFEKRYLFKRAFRNLLPAEIIHKTKHGFGLPVSGWLKTHPGLRELTRDTLGSVRCSTRGYFRRQFMEELFRRFEEDESTYYGDTLWTFLVLELWHNQVVDEPAKVCM